MSKRVVWVVEIKCPLHVCEPGAPTMGLSRRGRRLIVMR